VGGGIRSVADARRILLSGADKVSVNTAAVRRPELITELSNEFGAQAGSAGDRRAPADRRVVARLHARGPRRRRDRRGRSGPRAGEELGRRRNPADIDGFRRRAGRLRLPADPAVSRATTSRDRERRGGKPEHFIRVLTEGRADAALAASIFHYGTYTVNQLKEELDKRGIPVRIA
jgi:cyclase